MDEAVGVYVALVRSGAPIGQAFRRRYWDLAVQAAAGGVSQRSLRERTSTAKQLGLIEVSEGAGERPGAVKLRRPGHPDQLVPGTSHEALQAMCQADGEDVLEYEC